MLWRKARQNLKTNHYWLNLSLTKREANEKNRGES